VVDSGVASAPAIYLEVASTVAFGKFSMVQRYLYFILKIGDIPDSWVGFFPFFHSFCFDTVKRSQEEFFLFWVLFAEMLASMFAECLHGVLLHLRLIFGAGVVLVRWCGGHYDGCQNGLADQVR